MRTCGRSTRGLAAGLRRAATSSDAPAIVTLDRLLTHPDLVQLARALRETPGKAVSDDEPTSWAAIALILRMGALREPELLMIKRAEAEQDPWSGHVACPGGRMEPGTATWRTQPRARRGRRRGSISKA